MRIAMRWRLIRLSAWITAAGAVSLGVWLLLGVVVNDVPLLRTLGTIDAGLVTLVIGWLWLRRRPISAGTVALQYDRTVPALEESTGLLLEDADEGGPMRRMQRRRTTERFEAITAEPSFGHRGAWAAGVGIGLGAILVAASLLVTTGSATTAGDGPSGPEAVTGMVPAVLGEITIEWTTPEYLGRRSRSTRSGRVSIEAGSRVSWRIDASGVVKVLVVDPLGDTLQASQIEGEWVATGLVEGPRIWRALAIGTNGDTVSSPDGFIEVIPDRAPVIAVLAPAGRIEVEWNEPHQVVVRALVGDDYGIGSIELKATVAAGRGEGVRFREQQLALETESGDDRQRVVSRFIELDSLGVEPGDEVYLVIAARDKRAPMPQLTESETIFVTLSDTFDLGSAEFGGVAINIEPDLFRSQRQIILDTERLLRDIRLGTVAEPLGRSMDIGYDQHLLRLRYGAIAGQEDELGVTDPEADITEEDLRHDHDTEENATLLATSVKAILKGALAEMWEAEKFLRVGEPATALPFEYRALVALEEIRQAQRAYVKRIGFTPPPIEIEAVRLTRDATSLATLDRTDPSRPSQPDQILVDALNLLGTEPDGNAITVLESAGRRLAERTVSVEPGEHLETMAAIRALIDGTGNAETVSLAMSGLLVAVPRPLPPIVVTPRD